MDSRCGFSGGIFGDICGGIFAFGDICGVDAIAGSDLSDYLDDNLMQKHFSGKKKYIFLFYSEIERKNSGDVVFLVHFTRRFLLKSHSCEKFLPSMLSLD